MHRASDRKLARTIEPLKCKSLASMDVTAFLSARRLYEDALKTLPGLNAMPYLSCFEGECIALIEPMRLVML